MRNGKGRMLPRCLLLMAALGWSAGCATARGGGVGDPSMSSAQGFGASATADSGNSSLQSGESSGNSAASSGNSAESSAASGGNAEGSAESCGHSEQSSEGSGQSSNASGQSSNASGESSETSGGSSESSKSSEASSHNSGVESGRSSAVVAGSALIASTVAGLAAAIYASARSGDDDNRARAAAAYFRANSAQLRQDLALGAGPTVDDLAAAAEIPAVHRQHFARLLQRHRVELLAFGRLEELDAAGALALLARIGELVKADSVLQLDYQAYLAKNPELG